MQLFSERYSKLIDENDFLSSHPISDFQKTKWNDLLLRFNEDSIINPDRFNSRWQETTYISYRVFEIYYSNRDIQKPQGNQIINNGNYTIKELFDITELWHNDLSDTHKSDFTEEINQLFTSFKLPWRLLMNGRIIKIDPSQFSVDLKNQALELLQSMQTDDPVFQAAFEEFCKANEKRTSKDYLGAVLEACKSYESILKNITGQQQGSAEQLIKTLINKSLINIPSNINNKGFSDRILGALPYLRNNLPTAHGAGDTPSVEISDAFCNLAINLASTLNLFLIEEYREHIILREEKQSLDQGDDIPF